MPTDPVVAFIGLGSNLGDSLAELRAGRVAIAALPDTGAVECSPVYRTAPVAVAPQPDFLNACCRVRTGLSAQALLAALLSIERARGRCRGAGGEPRTLDLDLLLYGDLRCDTPELTLPHPRLHERAFVLYPLADIDAELVIPGLGRVQERLSGCAGQRVDRWAPASAGVQGGW